MTEQTWEPTFPPAKPYVRKAPIVITLGVLAVVVIGFLNLYESMKPVHHLPSPLALQQKSPVIQPPADPDAFDEDRDGSNALSLEDTNGKASIWQDTTTGARIFCLDSCMVLPRRAHHHHRTK